MKYLSETGAGNTCSCPGGNIDDLQHNCSPVQLMGEPKILRDDVGISGFWGRGA